VNPNPVFSLGPDQSLCPGDIITLTANIQGVLYDWYNHDKNSSITVSQAGTYWVTVTQQHCSAADSITIDYNNPHCACSLYVPNAFSPNKDKLNDELRIVNDQGVELLDFKIYNRFGNCVFKSKGLFDAWDGNYAGGPAEIGSYYYLLKYRCTYTGKEFFIKGDITLVR
jgi:gliding motility-associated-like protein